MNVVCTTARSTLARESHARRPFVVPTTTHDLPRCARPLQSEAPPACRASAQGPFAVNGSVEVELDVGRPTRCVVLHAAGMNITHAALLQPEHTHGAARGPRRPGSPAMSAGCSDACRGCVSYQVAVLSISLQSSVAARVVFRQLAACHG
jgi:hypothetical protein